jgi:two-component system chemotaxis response regulator CheY
MARILVIDDESMIRTFLRDVLEGAGHEVREGANGDEAVAAFGDFKPEILIVDLIMPEQDGLYAIREIRRSRPETKVIAISGMHSLAGFDYLKPAVKLGADLALYKPFSPKDLLRSINGLLAGDQGGNTAQN